MAKTVKKKSSRRGAAKKDAAKKVKEQKRTDAVQVGAEIDGDLWAELEARQSSGGFWNPDVEGDMILGTVVEIVDIPKSGRIAAHKAFRIDTGEGEFLVSDNLTAIAKHADEIEVGKTFGAKVCGINRDKKGKVKYKDIAVIVR